MRRGPYTPVTAVAVAAAMGLSAATGPVLVTAGVFSAPNTGDVKNVSGAARVVTLTGESDVVTVADATVFNKTTGQVYQFNVNAVGAMQVAASGVSTAFPTIGVARFQNAVVAIAFRNAANSANVPGLSLTSANVLNLGADASNTTVNNALVQIFGGASGVNIFGNTTTTANAFTFVSATFLAGSGQSNPTWKQSARSTDTAPQALTIQSQDPFASATGANRVPGDLKLVIGSPTNSGTTRGVGRLVNDGSDCITWTKDTSGNIQVAIRSPVQTTVGAAGGASALPATPTQYIPIVASNGTEYVVPAYAKS